LLQARPPATQYFDIFHSPDVSLREYNGPTLRRSSIVETSVDRDVDDLEIVLGPAPARQGKTYIHKECDIF